MLYLSSKTLSELYSFLCGQELSMKGIQTENQFSDENEHRVFASLFLVMCLFLNSKPFQGYVKCICFKDLFDKIF